MVTAIGCTFLDGERRDVQFLDKGLAPCIRLRNCAGSRHHDSVNEQGRQVDTILSEHSVLSLLAGYCKQDEGASGAENALGAVVV